MSVASYRIARGREEFIRGTDTKTGTELGRMEDYVYILPDSSIAVKALNQLTHQFIELKSRIETKNLNRKPIFTFESAPDGVNDLSINNHGFFNLSGIDLKYSQLDPDSITLRFGSYIKRDEIILQSDRLTNVYYSVFGTPGTFDKRMKNLLRVKSERKLEEDDKNGNSLVHIVRRYPHKVVTTLSEWMNTDLFPAIKNL